MTNSEYQKEYIRQVKFKLNMKTDREIIDWLDKQPNVQGYLKQLIRADMKEQNS